jgi:hypothetical protein
MEAVRVAAERLPTRQAYVHELTRLWREAQDRFVAIGEYLIHAKETLPHGEYEKMVASDLPFGRAVAHTLRTVALAVQDGRLGKIELPRSYTTAYFLATLEPHNLALARERGLVRQDVPRSTIEAFRRELKSPEKEGTDRSNLIRERVRLRVQLEAIKARLKEINQILGSDGQRIIEGALGTGSDEDAEAEC